LKIDGKTAWEHYKNACIQRIGTVSIMCLNTDREELNIGVLKLPWKDKGLMQ